MTADVGWPQLRWVVMTPARQLAVWQIVSTAVLIFGVAMIVLAATNGADAVMWAVLVFVTLAGAAGAVWTTSLRARL